MSWAKYSGFHFASKVGLAPASVTTTGVGSAIDRLTYDHAICIANTKVTSGTGTLDINIQDSADGSTGWADYVAPTIYDSNLSGVTTAAFPTISTDGIKKLDVDLGGAKRYIRFNKVASATGSPSMVISVDVLLGMRNGTAPGALS